MSSLYHPQTDGQLEALNKCLEVHFLCFVSENPKAWVQLLPQAQFWYNTAVNYSVAMTPFQVVFGRDPPQLIAYDSNDNDPPEVAILLQQRDKVLVQIKQNLLKAKIRMKKITNKKNRNFI